MEPLLLDLITVAERQLRADHNFVTEGLKLILCKLEGLIEEELQSKSSVSDEAGSDNQDTSKAGCR